MSSRRRLVHLMVAGVVDSLCLSFGWTVLLLLVVSELGLGAAGLVSAAMLVGVALSAPVASRLAHLLGGRLLLRSAASVEALLRVAVLGCLAAGAPLWVLAVCVSVLNVAAWTGYAGMRAEVAAASPGTSALTWYGAGIAGIEAVGAATAALLTSFVDLRDTGVLLVVTGVYVLGLVPTVVVAGGSPIQRPRPRTGSRLRGRRRAWRPVASLPVAAGALLMFVASAPTLLSVGLAAQLHGRASVALVAVSFTVGSLGAPFVASRVQRRHANGPVVWLACAWGMSVGWVLAPWSVALMMLAQVASGLCMTALEGLLDTATAAEAHSGATGATGALARGTAGRALGSAAGVALLPVAVSDVGLTATLVVVGGLLGTAALLVGQRHVRHTGGSWRGRSRVPGFLARPR